MNGSCIQTANDVYQFVEELERACKENPAPELLLKIENAMNLGSSALEILGAIRETVVNNRPEVERLLGSERSKSVDGVIAFVDRAFGR
jgi:anti-anti-sigma regulatory factor